MCKTCFMYFRRLVQCTGSVRVSPQRDPVCFCRREQNQPRCCMFPRAAIPAAAALVLGGRAAGFTPLPSVSRVSGLGSKAGAAPASKKALGTLSGRPEVRLGLPPQQHVQQCCLDAIGGLLTRAGTFGQHARVEGTSDQRRNLPVLSVLRIR